MASLGRLQPEPVLATVVALSLTARSAVDSRIEQLTAGMSREIWQKISVLPSA